MAESKKTYPMIAATVWWKLRDQFKKTLPGNVSRSYLATVLGIEERSAGNLLGPLRTVGLINEDGKPTERANHWRFDEDYRDVCQSMLEDTYPEELRQAVPTPTTNRDAAVRWFMRNAGVGQGGATKMAATYELMAESTPEARPVPTQPKAPRRKKPKQAPQTVKPAPSQPADPVPPTPDRKATGTMQTPPITKGSEGGPGLHIDIQIHIAADASAEQIDQIFASMVKHSV